MDSSDMPEDSGPPPESDDELIREAFLYLFGDDLLSTEATAVEFDPSWATGAPQEP